jgi:predicted RNA-binding protein with PIN domain
VQVVNGQGALTISTSLLIQEIKKVKRDSMEQLKDPLLNRVAGRRVQDNLSPEARDKLLAVLREDNARRRRGLGLG